MKSSCCGNDQSFRETSRDITRDVRGQTVDQLGLHWDNGTVTAYKQVPQGDAQKNCAFGASTPCAAGRALMSSLRETPSRHRNLVPHRLA